MLNQPGFRTFEFRLSKTCQRELWSKSKGHRQEWLSESYFFFVGHILWIHYMPSSRQR